LSLLGAGVESLVLAGEVVVPVFLEVAVADGGAEAEDGFGAVQARSGAVDVEAVGDEWTELRAEADIPWIPAPGMDSFRALSHPGPSWKRCLFTRAGSF
jgi:hypothetical protein